MSAWWIVILPGEDASTSEPYGPFRSENAAQAVADKWNRAARPDDQAIVMPVIPPSELASAAR
jgi:hypothetical protein